MILRSQKNNKAKSHIPIPSRDPPPDGRKPTAAAGGVVSSRIHSLLKIGILHFCIEGLRGTAKTDYEPTAPDS